MAAADLGTAVPHTTTDVLRRSLRTSTDELLDSVGGAFGGPIDLTAYEANYADDAAVESGKPFRTLLLSTVNQASKEWDFEDKTDGSSSSFGSSFGEGGPVLSELALSEDGEADHLDHLHLSMPASA